MNLVKRFFLPLLLICAMAFSAEEAQAQAALVNDGNCTWTVDFTTNVRLSTGVATLPPTGTYTPFLLPGEFVVLIRIDGVNYVPPVPPNCVTIPPNNTCNSLAHSLCWKSNIFWSIR